MLEETETRQVLVLVNQREDSLAAALWAAHWALRTRDELTLFHVIAPTQLMSFGLMHTMMEQEQRQKAGQDLDLLARDVQKITGQIPQIVLREGLLKETVRSFIAEQKNLSLLVIAAHHREDGPAPLIAYLSSRMGSRVQVPFVLVPEGLSEDRIAKLT